MLLIDRKHEIAFLEKAYRSDKSEFIIVYGRRRLGKTYLLKSFMEHKNHFYFLARQRDTTKEYEEFKEKLSKKFNAFFEADTFERLFEEIDKKIALKEKLVIIIDEFPYWIAKNKEIVSEFQYIWDEILSKKNVMLILLGSYMSIIENSLLSYKSPIYGRKSGQIELHQMPLSSLFEFFPKMEIEEIIKIYGFASTIPYYLSMIDKKADFLANLTSLLSPYSSYYNDAEILLREELREINVYLDILKSINDGATTLGEIANTSHIDITNILKYLHVLLGMKIIEKIKPLTSSPKEKNYLYTVRDNYFKFWLKFIYSYKTEIEENTREHITFIATEYTTYMGSVFEEFCRKAITETSLISFTAMGRWWHKDCEIDIVAIDEKKSTIYLGECKWANNVDGLKITRELHAKAEKVQWKNTSRTEIYLVFARTFSKKINEYEGRKVYCYDLKDLEKALKKIPSSIRVFGEMNPLSREFPNSTR